jgi:hypothetical protein
MKRSFAATLAALLVLVMALPAAAITQGTPDGDRHPMVGQLFFYVPDAPDPRFTTPGAWYSCTGTLIAPDVVLTAGHCVSGVGKDGSATSDGNGGNDLWISFQEFPDLSELPPSLSFEGDNAARYRQWTDVLNRDRTWLRASRVEAHPDYDDRSFYMADVGIVKLADKPKRGTPVASLPPVGYLDQVLADRTDDKLFTPVGYGVQSMVPFFDPGGSRQWATSKLIDLRGTHGIPAGTVAKFSNNLGVKHTGGACSGDSGGPLFKQGTTMIGAITSYGISPCIGNDGAYRIDKTLDLGWIQSFLPTKRK